MQAKPEDRTIIERARIEVNALRSACCKYFFVRTLALILFCVSAFSSCTSDDTKARRLARRAVEAVEAEQFDEAITFYREIVDTFPSTSSARDAEDRITFLSGLSQAVTSFSSRTARDLMVKTARAVQRYRYQRGRYPDTLDDLKPKLIDESPIDPWGRPLNYGRGKNGYRLICYGADGRQGGEGDATDFVVKNGKFISDPSGEGTH